MGFKFEESIIISWIGKTDLNASLAIGDVGVGPVAQAVSGHRFDLIVLLSNYSSEESANYVAWLEHCTTTPIELRSIELTSPTHFAEIYQSVTVVIRDMLDRYGESTRMTYHLSPGTPAMAAVWILVAKTRYPAELIESSKNYGVRTVSIPFDISAEFIPELLKGPDRNLSRLTSAIPNTISAFSSIIHRSEVMQRVIERAQKVVSRSIPVLIEGESGTGKEMLARAIHEAGPRTKANFISVNCGAIPKDLFESEFFGHKKGSFTGAHSDRKGHFEMADKGTLFLDEIGELPLDIQVRLLRVLQQNEVTRLGESVPIPVDVRIIAATNRKLVAEVEAGRFREDLFYRLAVAVIRVPPLRARAGDLTLLIDHLMDKINRESVTEPAWEEKKISPAAKNILLQQAWPGNVRELQNTLTRSVVWSSSNILAEDDIRDALLDTPLAGYQKNEVIDLPIHQGIDLQGLMSHVARHYLSRAIKETGGNLSKAAELLGLGSYQTLKNWIKKYEIDE